jgi:hypothetical protein
MHGRFQRYQLTVLKKMERVWKRFESAAGKIFSKY